MKFLILSLSLILSNMFFLSNHPISIVIIIIFQSLMICSIMFIYSHYGWFSLIMFLIFMGGLMVLFIYITSLASNEMFSIKINSIITISSLTFITFMMLMSPLFNFPTLSSSLNFKLNIFPVYSESFYSPTLTVMTFLLLTLVITVNIIKLYEAPIRSII